MKNKIVRIRRLGWAGVEIECENETLLIDYIQDKTPILPALRNKDEIFPKSSQQGVACAALLTHLHADHADADAIAAGLRKGAPVFRPPVATGTKDDIELTTFAEAKFKKHILATEIVGVWEEKTVGPFKVSTVPAVDGFGDLQISWVVECGGKKIIHCGDTLFHGYWWRIANKFGPFDIAFLPINAPVCQWPHLQPPSFIEAVMSPEEAANAGSILQAKCIVPIHYGSLNKKPFYVETENPEERLFEKSSDLGISVKICEPGEWFEVE